MSDRFFAIGALKLDSPSDLLRELQRLRDRRRFYEEFHWKQVNQRRLPRYREALELTVRSSGSFSCFVADRQQFDPVTRFGSPWRAYEKLAGQLLHASIRPRELLSVLADNYSTPNHVHFERDVKQEVNARLRRLAVTSVVRLDSRSTDGLQMVDLLLGAVLFEFKQAVGLAGVGTLKDGLSADVRRFYGVPSFVPSVQLPKKLSVACYRH